jgi:excisionase family DNA binding protein
MTPLLTPEQAAKLLGIGVDTLGDMRKTGELPYINIGRGTKRETPRYELDDLIAWKAKRKQRACPFSSRNGRSTGSTGASSNIRGNEFLRALEQRESSKRKSGKSVGEPKNDGK